MARVSAAMHTGVLLLLLPGGRPFHLSSPATAPQTSGFPPQPLMCAADAAEPAPASAAANTAEPPAGWDRSILTCARCKAAFIIDRTLFGEGQQVHCANCNNEWFQTADRLQTLPDGMELVEHPESMR